MRRFTARFCANKADEELRGITQLLGLDAKLVPTARVEPVERYAVRVFTDKQFRTSTYCIHEGYRIHKHSAFYPTAPFRYQRLAMSLEANRSEAMRKQIVTIVLGAAVMLGTATTLLAQNGLPTGGYPAVAGGANGNAGFIPFQTSSGKTVQLRTAKIHGHMMILVPMYMACDVFHVTC